MNKAEKLTKSIYKDFNYSHPSMVDLETLANFNYLFIEKEDLGKIDGLIIYNRYGGLIKVNSRINDIGWERFTIAHELGHFYYGFSKNDLTEDIIVSNTNDEINCKEEYFANSFAANLLMPSEFFMDYFRNREPTIENFRNLANSFIVSIPAAAVRYSIIGDETIFVILSNGKEIIWNCRSKKFPYNLNHFKGTIPPNSGPAVLLSNGQDYFYQEINSDIWFFDSMNLVSNYILKEESLRLSDGKSILTILRIVKF
jgi:Zn-dependent peptidase ImmA (M78 family)